MQEQVPSNITPEQGWSQMKVILDREMPAQRKSRRMITWWRSLMAVGLLTALSLTVYNTVQQEDQQNQQKQQPVTPPVMELPAAPAPVEEKSAAKQENTFAAATNDTDEQLQVTGDDKPSAATDTKRGGSINHTSATSTSMAQNATSSSSIATAANTKRDNTSAQRASSSNTTGNNAAKTSTDVAQTPITNTPLKSGSSINTSIDTDPEAAYQANSIDHDQTPAESSNSMAFDAEASINTHNAQRNGQVTVAIPVLMMNELPVEDRIAINVDWSDVNPVVGTIPAKRKGQLLEGYVAGSGMAGFRKGGAWQAGAGMSLRLVPKVRLSGGASYREYSPDFSIESLAVKAQQDAADLPIVNLDPLVNEGSGFVNDYVLNAGTTYESLEPLVKTLRQWQVDASITCDIGKRWFIQGGASYAMNTSAISSYPILEDAYLSNPYELRFTNELDNYEVLREHMVTLHGGLGYHLGRHWDLYVQADYGLQPYLLTDTSLSSGAASETDRKDYIRGLTLGVRYRVL